MTRPLARNQRRPARGATPLSQAWSHLGYNFPGVAHDTGGVATDAISSPEQDAPTTELLAGAVGDRCTNCQAPLASDQRYCVNCGQRRGRQRFAVDALATPAAAAPSEYTPPRRSRASSGTTLVAGVATLLIAMGVGVLIGHDSNSSPTRAGAPVQVVTVGGGGGTGAATGSGSAATASGPTGKASKTKLKPTKVHLTPKVTHAAAAAAQKVLGGGAPKNPTIQDGQSCSAGTAGCQGGKFTGNFFGP